MYEGKGGSVCLFVLNLLCLPNCATHSMLTGLGC